MAGSATASPASAHNVLRSTSPADSSTVDTVPAEVVLTFDEPAIAMGTTIVVTGPDGAVSDGSPRLVDNTVSQPLKPGAPAGEYTVEWRVTSADGHPITGTFAFSARSAATNAAGPSPAASGIRRHDRTGPHRRRHPRLGLAGDRRHAAAVRRHLGRNRPSPPPLPLTEP